MKSVFVLSVLAFDHAVPTTISAAFAFESSADEFRPLPPMTRLPGICFATSSRILPAGPARESATIASGLSAFAAVTNGAKSTSVAR